MQAFLDTLLGLDPVVLFVLAFSGAVNKYSRIFPYKFIAPSIFSFMGAFFTAGEPSVTWAYISELMNQWFVYCGQSMILYQFYKHVLKNFAKMMEAKVSDGK